MQNGSMKSKWPLVVHLLIEDTAGMLIKFGADSELRKIVPFFPPSFF